LKNLEILDISWNNFNDTDIASALSGLSSLKSLILQGSEITLRSIHSMSDFALIFTFFLIIFLFFYLKAYATLIMYIYILLDISKLRSLEILDLNGNGLSNNIISSINGLPRLKSLDLSSNKLNGSLDISGEY